MKGKIINLEKISPFYLFSLEDYLLSNINEFYVIFYSFPPCVILGRSSKVEDEVFVENIIQDNIIIARRQSGGGVVYITPDQLCVSFLFPKEIKLPEDLKEKYTFLASITAKSLSDFGDFTFDERGNIFSRDGGKISGCSGYLNKHGYLHHFTLIRKPIKNMEKYLKKIKYKTSFINVPKEQLKKAITKGLKDYFSITFKEFLIDSIDLSNILSKYKDKNYIFRL